MLNRARHDRPAFVDEEISKEPEKVLVHQTLFPLFRKLQFKCVTSLIINSFLIIRTLFYIFCSQREELFLLEVILVNVYLLLIYGDHLQKEIQMW